MGGPVANKKRKKDSAQSKILSDARRYVIKKGEYNGADDSSAFMVSGHSTGSPYSEMEELSNQVTRDAGGLPYKQVEFGSDQGETGYDLDQGEGLGDLGGPEMYGPKPSLLRKSPIARERTSRGLAIGAAVGLGVAAVLGGLAYYMRRPTPPPPHRHAKKHAPPPPPPEKRAGRTKTRASGKTRGRQSSNASARA